MYLLKSFSLLLGGCSSLVSVWSAPEPLNASATARWVPEQAVLCLEMLQPGELVEPLLRPEVAERFAALPVIAQGQESEGFQGFLAAVRYVEATSRTNWQTVVRSLTHDGFVFAVGAGDRYLLLIDGADPGMLGKLHETARQIAASEAQKEGHPERVDVRPVGGVRGWSFNGKEAHAVVEDCLLAASDPEVLEAALNLRSGSGRSLVERADYQAARRAVGTQAVAMAFLDLQQVRAAPKFLESLKGQAGNPLAALLLAEMPNLLLNAPWLAVGVYLDGNDLRLQAFAGDSDPRQVSPSFVPSAGATRAAPTYPPVPRQIASLRLNRDLATFYGDKDRLFPQRTSGLIFFENMMGIFFSGRNLTDEILAALRSDIRVVVARQDYDSVVGIPEPQLPAFALVFGVRDPAAFNEVLEEAWQKALGLVNFTRGQKALPGLILDRVSHDGTPMTVAAYSSKEVEDRSHLDQRFNFRPTLAMAHGAAVLSSTDQLAGDLMDAMGPAAGSKTGGATEAHTVLQIRGGELAAALRANRAGLVRNSMIKDGKTETEAELGIDTLCTVVSWVEGLFARVGPGEHGRFAEVRLSFTQP